MSLTVKQIIMDAKTLALKLKESNNAADNLLCQGQSVHRQIDTMKQVYIFQFSFLKFGK